MSLVTHFGIAPSDLNEVLGIFLQASTDVDSWHVWGQPLNTPENFRGDDSLHIIVYGDRMDELTTLVKSKELHLREMQTEDTTRTGILAVVTNDCDWSEVEGSLWLHDFEDEPKATVEDDGLFSETGYYMAESLEPVDVELLMELLNPFIDNLLEDRIIVRQEDAEDLLQRRSN